MYIDKEKWNYLIEKHYISICDRKHPPFKHTIVEMVEWWYKIIRIQGEKEAELTIKSITNCNDKGIFYHPV